MATPCSAAISTVRRMLLGSPAWKPVAMLALLISGMIAASTPSPMVHGPKPSPMSELRSIVALLMKQDLLPFAGRWPAQCLHSSEAPGG